MQNEYQSKTTLLKFMEDNKSAYKLYNKKSDSKIMDLNIEQTLNEKDVPRIEWNEKMRELKSGKNFDINSGSLNNESLSTSNKQE
jgi:tRNA A37 threonylcarbamoyladenosine biosynthesis protein TsaE